MTLPMPELHPAIRPATEADVPALIGLIKELAAYEREPDAVKITEEQLTALLFGPDPRVYALVAEDQQRVAGMAIYFLNFSTWEGKLGIYLEDLYVSPESRGSGLGKALLQSLAAIAVARDYGRFEWAVLDWNQPALDFYRSLGAVPMEEWTVHRLAGDALAQAGKPYA
ncbi:GNAT family N-acetyltransferase [Microlunatus sp. GCM10028923]|uniref:GNAT family N-acetyltransferase n=1 Tax=Microlunatus sp. GCM10028923 TaxID=3273400 RepID=UPI00361DD769